MIIYVPEIIRNVSLIGNDKNHSNRRCFITRAKLENENLKWKDMVEYLRTVQKAGSFLNILQNSWKFKCLMGDGEILQGSQPAPVDVNRKSIHII